MKFRLLITLALLMALAVPILSVSWVMAAVSKAPYEEIELLTPDNVKLFGRLYDPTQKAEVDSEGEEEEAVADDEEIAPEFNPAKARVRYPLVILLHGLNGAASEWGDLPDNLMKKGYAVFAMDMRGHGMSTYNKAGRRLTWRTFQKKDWDQMPRDIERVIRFFETSAEDYPQVDTRSVSLIASKLGANVAIIAAGRDTKKQIKSMVAISPGRNYKGLETSEAILVYKNALLMMTNPEDIYAFDSTQLLYRWSLSPKTLEVYKNVDNGADMLRAPALQSKVILWLEKHVAPNKLHQAR